MPRGGKLLLQSIATDLEHDHTHGNDHSRRPLQIVVSRQTPKQARGEQGIEFRDPFTAIRVVPLLLSHFEPPCSSEDVGTPHVKHRLEAFQAQWLKSGILSVL